MSEAANGQTPAEAGIAAEAEERRKKLAEAATTIGEIVIRDPNMRPEEVETWKKAANASLESLAPNHNVPTKRPETVARLTGRFLNDMEFPGSKSIKRAIQWVEDHL